MAFRTASFAGDVGFEGRVAWVTGAGRGIGRAAALALAREGCNVAVSSRTRAELDETVKACQEEDGRAEAVPCDVTELASVSQAYKAIRQSLGAPSILVNAAGLARSAPFLKTDANLMTDLWRLNLLGSFHAIRAALPAMIEAGWGRIVNVASVAGKVGAPYIAAYASSKHAVLGLTRSVAAEFAMRGVTANAVCPGYVDTKMTEDNVRNIVEKTGKSRAETLSFMQSQSPQNRMMTPEEVATTIVHLCRDESKGINGQAVTIDGGGLQW